MTPLAQSNLEHGKEFIGSKSEPVDTFLNHTDSIDIQQGRMAPPSAISSNQLIDPHMSLDPEFLVPIEQTVGSDPTQSIDLPSKYNKSSLVLPSTKDNIDSLIKIE